MPRLAARPRGQASERGVALLLVLIMLALLGTVVGDFQYNSEIDFRLALNARDELQAEYNALSALRMRALLLKQSGKVKAGLAAIQQAIGMDTSAALPIAQLLESIPIECGLLSAITKSGGAPATESEEDEGFFPGECIATSTSEHSKISLNMLRNATNQQSKQVSVLLLGLLSDPKLERHFQEDDRNGRHAENALELVGALQDWTDDDTVQAVNSVGDEDRFYDFSRDPYDVKNAPFDSLAEIQLVHGMDDELYQLIKDNVSIYSDSTQLELATAPPERIVLWGLPACLREGVYAEQLFAHPGLGPFYRDVLDLKTIGATGFGVLNVAVLRTLLQQYGLDGFLDTNKIGQVFTDKASTTWYTIDAQGRAGNVSRRIRAVFQAQEGQFYYARVE